MNLNRVILSWPTLLSAPAAEKADVAPRSWIQIARTGEFTSNRYGEFSITREDLSRMLNNFRSITPKAPTELPVDFDHLSMQPARPLDGIAAGWMKQLELRANGDELWAEVEWTPQGADCIAKKEYRFVSPSFVKDYTHKDGRKIGTTLLAAAITNHPFLEGMKALTLYNFSAMGDLALADTPATTAPVHLAEVGQRLTFIENEEATPELSPKDRAQVFVVTAIGGGTGDNAFVKLETAEGGKPYGWYPLKVLAPAPASAPKHTTEENPIMDTKTTETNIEQKAAAFAARVTALSKDRPLRDAISLATTQDTKGAEAYRLAGIGAEPVNDAPAPISLSARTGESFDTLAMRYANEHGVSLRQAVHEIGKARPDLAATRG